MGYQLNIQFTSTSQINSKPEGIYIHCVFYIGWQKVREKNTLLSIQYVKVTPASKWFNRVKMLNEDDFTPSMKNSIFFLNDGVKMLVAPRPNTKGSDDVWS